MATLSYSANLAWQFSAREAAAAQSEFIEPEHVLIGILNLEKISAQDEELSPSALQSLLAEQDDVSELLRDFELDVTELRRNLRGALGDGKYQHQEKIVHRSAACKAVFKRAGELAKSQDAPATCLCMLVAVLENPHPAIVSVLNVAGVTPEAVRIRA